MRNLLIIVAAVLLLAGCGLQLAHMQRASSGHVPCSPNEITIRQTSTSAIGNITWIATCRGEQWYCSQRTAGTLGGGPLTHHCVRR